MDVVDHGEIIKLFRDCPTRSMSRLSARGPTTVSAATRSTAHVADKNDPVYTDMRGCA